MYIPRGWQSASLKSFCCFTTPSPVLWFISGEKQTSDEGACWCLRMEAADVTIISCSQIILCSPTRNKLPSTVTHYILNYRVIWNAALNFALAKAVFNLPRQCQNFKGPVGAVLTPFKVSEQIEQKSARFTSISLYKYSGAFHGSWTSRVL